MSFVNYTDLTITQKREAILLRPKWAATDFPRFMMWVKPDGHISRKAGHHRLTEAEGKAIENFLRHEDERFGPPGKGIIRDEWKPGAEFHLDTGPRRKTAS